MSAGGNAGGAARGVAMRGKPPAHMRAGAGRRAQRTSARQWATSGLTSCTGRSPAGTGDSSAWRTVAALEAPVRHTTTLLAAFITGIDMEMEPAVADFWTDST